jgi:hypothetical protein
LCGKTRRIAPLSFAASISEAWQSLSSRTTSFFVTSAGIEPSAAAYPLLKQSAAWRLRAADQTRSSRAHSEFVDGSDRRFTESRIICKPEVIIRGKINDSATGYFNFRALRSADFKKMSIE